MPREGTDTTSPATEAMDLGYGPTTRSNWKAPIPKNVDEALDVIGATGLLNLIGGTANGVVTLNVGQTALEVESDLVFSANALLITNGRGLAVEGYAAGGFQTIEFGDLTNPDPVRLRWFADAAIGDLHWNGNQHRFEFQNDVSFATDQLLDSNGNKVIKFSPAGGTVVNEVTIGNAATGDDVTIAATGTDAVIAIRLEPKGATGLAHTRTKNEMRVFRDANSAILRLVTHSNTAGHKSNVNLQRANGTEAVPTNVVNGNAIAAFSSAGYHSGAYRFRGRVAFNVDAVPSGSSVPIAIDFDTGAAALATRLRIASGGNIRVLGANHLQFNSAAAYVYAPSVGNLVVHAATLLTLRGTANRVYGSSHLEFESAAAYVHAPAAGQLSIYSSTTTKLLTTGSVVRMEVDPTGIGFFAVAPVAQPTVVGARNNPTGALTSFLTALEGLGLIVDDSVAGDPFTDSTPIPFNTMKAPGTKPATFVEWGITGVWQFTDGTDDTVVFMLTPPSKMDRTVAPSIKLRWGTNTGVDTETAVWQLEYLYLQEGEDATAAAQDTLTVNSNAIAQTNGLVIAEFAGMDLLHADDLCICCRLKRLGADGADDLTDTAELHAATFNYTLVAGLH